MIDIGDFLTSRKGRKGMAEDFVALMQAIAPEMAEAMARRAMVLTAIAESAPVGRRQLALRLNLAEREVRADVEKLRDAGLITLDKAGMNPTPNASRWLESARSFARQAQGLTALETALMQVLPVKTVFVAPGDADADVRVLSDVGRLAAQGVRQLLHSGSTLAVTGGSTIAATAHAMQSSAPMNVMVVPAQGGFGREMETQANTLAAEIAQRLGGHHRLLHLPDHMDEQAKQEMLRLPEIRETMERIQRADIILHGIGCAQETMSRLPVEQVRLLMKKGAVGESFGAYYDREGQCLLKSSGVCVDLARLTPDCRMIAVAAGAKKAEAIISVLRHDPHMLLVTDEGAAKQMLAILKTNTGCSSVTDV